ncbi:1-acyldihydroxyacetone-phosphate reductase [Trichoderma arundinaceum]|uniref:1-acyldihydroxyacetone-phosphate reductase n=1 Tax=Trichoderma arundinaceum TaxID=490622 RepID=A0A395NYD4_TRIAR|nr:1-acyldihydroxyacetone-phosphate reductase [Trichoderma arundinaceum]
MASGKKFVLITGCSPGGIGSALALEFQRRARNVDVLKELADKGMSAVQLDVTNQDSINACKAEVASITGGRLDILVNNAGRTHTIPALDIEIDDVRQTFETNVFGPMFTTQAFAEQLIAARGLVVNISSLSSISAYIFGSVYASTKGAINSYSRVLRLELKPFNVRVMVAMAGTVRSQIASHAHRSLPSTSLYQPIDDYFQKRLVFSQNNATVPTEVFARKLVSAALKGEGYFGGLIGGTPDWFWAGGFSRGVWVLSLFPAWVSEKVIGVFFGIAGLKKRLTEARLKQS